MLDIATFSRLRLVAQDTTYLNCLDCDVIVGPSLIHFLYSNTYTCRSAFSFYRWGWWRRRGWAVPRCKRRSLPRWWWCWHCRQSSEARCLKGQVWDRLRKCQLCFRCFLFEVFRRLLSSANMTLNASWNKGCLFTIQTWTASFNCWSCDILLQDHFELHQPISVKN